MNTRRIRRIPLVLVGLAVLMTTSCASLPPAAPVAPDAEVWPQAELERFRRIRNDPRLYGVQLDPALYENRR